MKKRVGGIAEIIGKTGRKNTFGEEVQKLDDFANTLLIETLLASGHVFAVVSEEEKEPIYAAKDNAGDFIVYFDPLDGSSNIDTNAPIGTIFSIYLKGGGLLQKGEKQIAAGYILYGASVMFVYTTGSSVNGFTLDSSIGSFFLSHPDLHIPNTNDMYSINEAYELSYSTPVQSYLRSIKKRVISQRYIGSLVADAHRTLLKGGIFLYPASKTRPEGKLRLMLEVNPFAFLIEKAGGKALGHNNVNPLFHTPTHIHERSPLIIGSQKAVADYLSFFTRSDV